MYLDLKAEVCLGLLDAQDANSMLKHGVFAMHLDIMMAGFLVKIYREIGEMRVGAKYSFARIKDDMDLIKKKLKV